jgi:hypothetical protein
MREENIKTIREACVASNPERALSIGNESSEIIYPIRLGDVLYAIGSQTSYQLTPLGPGESEICAMLNDEESVCLTWDLRKDVSDQSDESLESLAELLGD